MSVKSTHKLPREWLWLVLALALVGGITVPLWIKFVLPQQEQQADSQQESTSEWKSWKDPKRVARLLLGPEQIACYLCFVWAGMMLLRRHREVTRQRQAFHLEILPTEEGARILPEDSRPLNRKIEAITRGRPLMLAKMIQMALTKFATSRKANDVSEVVRTQAEVEQSRLVTSMSTISYLTWAIPALGFLGTVRGLAGGMSMAGNQTDAQFIKQVTEQLAVAFDCTFVALSLSVVLMYLLHVVQRAEELLVIDCQQYCQEHLLLRLYDPQPENAYAERD